MDVATVVVPISNMGIYYYSAVIATIILSLAAFFGWCDVGNKKSVFALWIIALICAGTAFAVASDYFTEKQENFDETLLQAQNTKEQFAEKKFFIREMQQKDSFEIAGQMGGGFLLIAGAVYGEIEGKEIKKITLVYNEQDTQRHHIKTFLLEKFSIVTISKDDDPYYQYSDAYYTKKELTQTTYFKVESGEPVLYLPYGWEILNNLQRYPQ